MHHGFHPKAELACISTSAITHRCFHSETGALWFRLCCCEWPHNWSNVKKVAIALVTVFWGFFCCSGCFVVCCVVFCFFFSFPEPLHCLYVFLDWISDCCMLQCEVLHMGRQSVTICMEKMASPFIFLSTVIPKKWGNRKKNKGLCHASVGKIYKLSFQLHRSMHLLD